MSSLLACQSVCRLTAALFSNAQGQVDLPLPRHQPLHWPLPQAISLKQQVCCHVLCTLYSLSSTLAAPVLHCACDNYGGATVCCALQVMHHKQDMNVDQGIFLNGGTHILPATADLFWNRAYSTAVRHSAWLSKPVHTSLCIHRQSTEQECIAPLCFTRTHGKHFRKVQLILSFQHVAYET